MNAHRIFKLISSFSYMVGFWVNPELLCPYEAVRYAEKNKVLAIEDHNYGRIDPSTLDGVDKAVPNLEVLIFRNTSIFSIAPDTFYPLRTLQCLDLSRNKVSLLFGSQFRGLGNLETVILNTNEIQTLRDSVFLNLNNLKKLDLSKNRIIDISYSAFRGLDRLEELHMDNNALGTISGLVFEHIPNLKILYLGNNPLKFLDLSALRRLSHLSIPSTDFTAFPNLPRALETVDLQRSNLTRLDKFIFKHLPFLQDLRISGNPWICDCDSVNAMQTVIQSTIVKDRTNLLCASPAPMRGFSFASSLKLMECSTLSELANRFEKIQQITTLSFDFSIQPGVSPKFPDITAFSTTLSVPIITTQKEKPPPLKNRQHPRESIDHDSKNRVELNTGLSQIALQLPRNGGSIIQLQPHPQNPTTLTDQKEFTDTFTLTSPLISSETIRPVSSTEALTYDSKASTTLAKKEAPKPDSTTLNSASKIFPKIIRTNSVVPTNSASFLDDEIPLKVVLLSLLFGLCIGMIILLICCVVKLWKKQQNNKLHTLFRRKHSSLNPSPFCTVSPNRGDVIMRDSFGFRDNEYRSGNFALVSARHTLFPGLFAKTLTEGENDSQLSENSPSNSVNSTTQLCPEAITPPMAENYFKTPSVNSHFHGTKNIIFSEEIVETPEFSENEEEDGRSSLELSSSPSRSLVSIDVINTSK